MKLVALEILLKAFQDVPSDFTHDVIFLQKHGVKVHAFSSNLTFLSQIHLQVTYQPLDHAYQN